MADNIATNFIGRLAQAKAFRALLAPDPKIFGLDSTKFDQYSTAVDALESSVNAEIVKEAELTAIGGERRGNDETLEDLTRTYRGVAQAHPDKTEAQKASLAAIFPSGGGDGDSQIDPLSVPPLLTHEPQGHLHSLLRIFDVRNPDNHSKKVPTGCVCNIYIKIDGAPPASLKECEMIDSTGRPPYIHEHEPEEIGKTVHFVGAWKDKESRELSAMSEVISITVA